MYRFFYYSPSNFAQYVPVVQYTPEHPVLRRFACLSISQVSSPYILTPTVRKYPKYR